MSGDFHVLPTPKLKQAAKDCPLLECDSETWIACCSRRFLPLAKRVAGDDRLAEDILHKEISRRLHVSRGNVAVRMNRAIALLKRRIDARTQSLSPKGSSQP